MSNPDPLPNHDALHRAVKHSMEWEALAVREAGRSYEREEGKVADRVEDDFCETWSGDVPNVYGRVRVGDGLLGPTIEVLAPHTGKWEGVDGVIGQLVAGHLATHLVTALQAATKGDKENEGAQAERDAVRRFLRRCRADTARARSEAINQRAATWLGGYLQACEAALEWLDGRSSRFTKAKGGLVGRKRGKRGGKGAK